MSSRRIERPRTRRQFLGDALRWGMGAAALGLLNPQAAIPVLAQGKVPQRVTVLIDDLVDATEADFARGQPRGVAIGAEAGHGVLRGGRGGEFTSRVLPLPFAATHLGVHWVLRDAPPEVIASEVRSSLDGRNWTEWQPLAVEAVSDLPSGREVFAALASGRHGRFAQYRIRFQSDQMATVDRVAVTAINSVDGPSQPLAATAPPIVQLSAGGTTIDVVTRDGWGCDESLRSRGKRETWPEMYVPAKKFVLHHTATPNDYTDAAHEIRAIYTYHTRTLGWGDIGYNSLVDRDGNVYEGRHGRGESTGREILSADVVAGHVYGHNYGSTGLAALGNFDTATPTLDMLTSIEAVATFECARHHIDPSASSDFLRSDDVWHKGLNNVSGHYESYNTECPGTNLKSYLPTLRGNVASRLAGSAAPDLRSPSSREQTAPGALSFTWPTTGGPYSYCLEGWYKPSSSYDISYLQGYATDTQYSDSLAKVQVWKAASGSSAAFSNLSAGHYTMHLLAASGKYEANLTFLVKGSSSPSKRK